MEIIRLKWYVMQKLQESPVCLSMKKITLIHYVSGATNVTIDMLFSAGNPLSPETSGLNIF